MTDHDLKEYLQNNFKNVQLSAKSKNKLRQNMMKELSQVHASTGLKLLRRWREFLETTYEINIAPLGAALGILVLFVNISFFSYLWDTGSNKNPGPTSYVQQSVMSPDGRLIIQFIPVDKEEPL